MNNNQSLRLYPEKEVRALLKEVGTLTQKQIDWHINELNAIELPSDEEVQDAFDKFYQKSNDEFVLRYAYMGAFEDGAEWVIEQIKQQAE